MRNVFAVLAAVVLAGSGFAQEQPKPGKEHDFLKKLEGKWDAVMTLGGKDEKCTATYKMDLGGFWLTCTMDGELFGQKFTGKSSEGYCPIKKKYVGVWTDSMSPTPVITEGTYDADKKTLTMAGEGPNMMENKMAKYKSVTVWKDDDTYTMSMYVDDAKEPMFSVKYTRAKK
jgi:hypothetical protein